MKDKYFLMWIHDRLADTHNENLNVDYMHKLRAIIDSIPESSETPNVTSKGKTYE